MNTYEEFLLSKKQTAIKSGFVVKESELPDYLFPFQKFCVRRAIEHGKYAIFSGTGSGKTRCEIAYADKVTTHTNKPVLILTNLAIAGQFIKESKKIGVLVQKLKEALPLPDGNNDLFNCDQGIYVCNYEQLDAIAEYIQMFSGIICDESAILANYEGKTKAKLIEYFKNIPYKLCASATPAPNDPMEIGNHAEFLDVMSRNEMLAMYFVHDGGNTSQWRLKGHAEDRFYEWMASWCIMFDRPGDIGFDNTGYDLPPLNIYEEHVPVPPRDNGLLFSYGSVSATNYNAELRATKEERMRRTAEIVNGKPDESFIIWIKHNEEADYLKKLIPGILEVRGSDDPDYKEEMLLGFAENKFRVLLTKTRIASAGLNYQHCNNEIFASPDFSFKDFYQGIRRIWRFGQNEPCNIWVLVTDSMQNVVQTIKEKEKNFKLMLSKMTQAVNSNMSEDFLQKREFDIEEEKNEYYHIRRGDCVQLIKDVPDNSVGFSVYSPPFASLYTYSDHVEDMGNCTDHTQFMEQFKFLVKEMYRVMKPGRNVAVHCMDLPIQKGKEGYIGLRDFSNMIREVFCGKTDALQKELSYLLSLEQEMKEGFYDTEEIAFIEYTRPHWLQTKIKNVEKQIENERDFIFHCRTTIRKSPVIEVQRTKALGLLHKQVKKDAAMSRVGIPDYLMVFRKPGDSDDPVIHQDTDSSLPNYLPVELWQKIAEPVWMDIDYSDTLQFRTARDEKDERHIAPLTLPIIERATFLWSNQGDKVLTTFAGIGSEVWQAVKMGRYGIGFELKESYFDLMKQNLHNLISEMNQPTLF